MKQNLFNHKLLIGLHFYSHEYQELDLYEHLTLYMYYTYHDFYIHPLSIVPYKITIYNEFK